jgi:hypothetical protein
MHEPVFVVLNFGPVNVWWVWCGSALVHYPFICVYNMHVDIPWHALAPPVKVLDCAFSMPVNVSFIIASVDSSPAQFA